MITALVLASMAALLCLCLTRLLRAPAASPRTEESTGYPESMTAELDPGDEEFLAWLASELWPDDEYLDMEPSTDGEEEAGGSMAR
ncbi:hypothetical protein [Actinomadura hibisca]|uniref:hypothetical protein n=1 Tax=Actinomadura hibisca TaxID=68565 RepID=UPI00082BEEC0|nr:hypothetical protein [Actinomadura hibisca]